MTLVASTALHVLDTFRVPYRLAPELDDPGAGRVVSERGAELVWLRPAPATPSWHRLADVPVYGAIASDADVSAARDRSAREWRRAHEITTSGGQTVGHVWLAEDGSALLPFDPDAIVEALLRESYTRSSGAGSAARRLYYLVRPLLPRGVQMRLRRRFARVQERAAFPAWPTETALHDLYALLLSLLEDVLGSPLPWIAPWPDPYRWCVVLTHDVERSAGYGHIDRVTNLERAAGARSAWYLVPERDYDVSDELVQALARDGFEIAVHGLRHDGRDLADGAFDERLPAMRAYADRWGAVGFRSPATQRDWDRIARLGFEHDSSYSDVARYEPQSGGSCSWYPFFVGTVVELPITLPMDHTLFDLLGRSDAEPWFEKARVLCERGGMALLLTHPDYLLESWRLGEYERFLTHVSVDAEAWHALPRDVAGWWRRRAASSLERHGDVWRVVGPAAAEARVVLGSSGV